MTKISPNFSSQSPIDVRNVICIKLVPPETCISQWIPKIKYMNKMHQSEISKCKEKLPANIKNQTNEQKKTKFSPILNN